MLPRYITKKEQTYDKIFKNNDPFNATCFYGAVSNEKFFTLLDKAIKRGTPVTQNELFILLGGEKNYHAFVKYTREYYQGYEYEPPL